MNENLNEHLNDEEREKLRLENEIRKIKMELEKGAKFIEDPDMPALPPEIENEFLNYIEQFEKMNENSPKISIFEKIGKPEFKTVAEISDDEIPAELDKLFELLIENNIHVDSVYEVEDREMYRFLTEDIFKHEVYEMKKIEGMMTHFTYEEFYPDDVKDVISHIETFFEAFFDVADEENRFQYEVNHLESSNQWLYEFRDAYYKFDLHALMIREVQIHDDEVWEAEAVFEISFDAYTNGKTEKHTYNGMGKAALRFTPGGWRIESIVLPKAI